MKYLILLSIALLFIQCNEPCDNIDCGIHGTCILGDCDCNDGWTGPDCNIKNPEPLSCSTRHQDSLSLLNLFFVTNGENWTYEGTDFGFALPIPNYKSEWNFTMPISTWHGIQVDSAGCLTRIILDDCNLAGNLPKLSFTTLEIFSCSENQLTGNIPNLNELPNLTWFNCQDNQLTGNIPSLSQLLNLNYFKCAINQLTGNIPNLSELKNLEQFICWTNQLTGNIPDLSELKKMRVFSCRNNQLIGSIPDLSELPKLSSFSCGNNQLTGSLPNLAERPNLLSFYCDDNELTGSIPDLTQVRYFDCSNNQLTGSIPDLTELPNLKSFRCSNNSLTGCMPYNDTICNNGLYDFENNPGLAWLGDYARVCNTENQIGAPCVKTNGSAGIISSDCNCD